MAFSYFITIFYYPLWPYSMFCIFDINKES